MPAIPCLPTTDTAGASTEAAFSVQVYRQLQTA